MGEEAKQEEAKVEVKPEETKEGNKEEEKPPLPFVIYVDLHCVGCAKKIEKSILKIRGVEEVEIDMIQNQVAIKGVVEPQAVCAKITRRTKRRAQILSPLPASEGEPLPQIVNSQVSGLTAVELNVKMHCEACAEQLKKKILNMRGVRTATTELSLGKVTVTGTMDPNTLVDYVYKRTKKQAKIVPQPEPELEEKKEEKVEPEPKPEEKKEEVPPEKAEEKKEGKNENKKEKGGENKEEVKKEVEEEQINNILSDEQAMQKMVYYHQPLYVIERIPPPQLFSDENPNACCIT